MEARETAVPRIVAKGYVRKVENQDSADWNRLESGEATPSTATCITLF